MQVKVREKKSHPYNLSVTQLKTRRHSQKMLWWQFSIEHQTLNADLVSLGWQLFPLYSNLFWFPADSFCLSCVKFRNYHNTRGQFILPANQLLLVEFLWVCISWFPGWEISTSKGNDCSTHRSEHKYECRWLHCGLPSIAKHKDHFLVQRDNPDWTLAWVSRESVLQ